MMKNIFLYILLLLTSCQANPKQAVQEQTAQDTATVQTRFPYPEIPTLLTVPGDRKDYLLTHYWDCFDFADTALVSNRNVSEQGFVDFIALLADGQKEEVGVVCVRKVIACLTNVKWQLCCQFWTLKLC